jgi:hypothetical protein
MSNAFRRTFVIGILLIVCNLIYAQSSLSFYAGGTGKNSFYDVVQISDGTILVCGFTENLNWIDVSVPRIILSYQGQIPNAAGTNRYGLILHLSSDLSSILNVVHFPQGAVEDIRFMKFSSQPYQTTEAMFISCTTEDSDANNGGYIIAKLDNNFLNGVPSNIVWYRTAWAKSDIKDNQPWDVTSDGKVFYITGEPHGYDWSAVYCLDYNGNRTVVEHWRTHWLTNNTEWKGTPASSNPLGTGGVNYSGIVFKIWGRCELRSWNATEFNLNSPDGNGGTRKGKWPADFLFDSPCDPSNPTSTGPGYNGYSAEACCPVWGASSLTIDKRNNHLYLGINFKSYSHEFSSPDFEPAVIAFSEDGELLWWNRLYHEITPQGDTLISLPDQYIDGLAIDYHQNTLVVGARCHGNSSNNFWIGNQIVANPNAYGFQNQFTGNSGNIHLSWLGKLSLATGELTNATYLGEYAEATGGFGSIHPHPNLDGWPNPNSGWPNLNTTRLVRNAIKVSSNGDVICMASGRRTITTADAYQKMVKPFYGGLSAWNRFVRMYDADFSIPKYSSLVVGVWDTLTQAGGDNIELFGVWKTSEGIIATGFQKQDSNQNPLGNPIPTANVPDWASYAPENQSAVLVYYKAIGLNNPSDGPLITSNEKSFDGSAWKPTYLFPNPTTDNIVIIVSGKKILSFRLFNKLGQLCLKSAGAEINSQQLSRGVYIVEVNFADGSSDFLRFIKE